MEKPDSKIFVFPLFQFWKTIFKALYKLHIRKQNKENLGNKKRDKTLSSDYNIYHILFFVYF